jgi:methyl-accepting chemotaxis protein
MSIVGFAGWHYVKSLEGEYQDLYRNHLQGAVYLASAQDALWQLRYGFPQYMIATDDASRKKITDDEPKLVKVVGENIAAYHALDLTDDEKQALAGLDEVWAKYTGARPKWFELYGAGKLDEAAEWRAATTTPWGAGTVKAFSDQIALQRQLAAKKEQQVLEESRTATIVLVGLITAALVLGLGVALVLSTTIASAVRKVATAARKVAREDLPAFADFARSLAGGDLTQRLVFQTTHVDVRSKDELGSMAADFNQMMDRLQEAGDAFARMGDNLRGLVGEVQASASAVAGASNAVGATSDEAGQAVQHVSEGIRGVASGARDTSRGAYETNAAVGQLTLAIDSIAQGASEQARQVQQASATATQMATAVEQVAQSANSVAATSQRTKVAAEQGAEAVQETVASMADIQVEVSAAAEKIAELGKLGERIGAVVDTIDDIAEQTNLLALNAAIEAARAGEHGKGFAVVADEVRKLAERSSRETKQISELIAQVQGGTREAVRAMEKGSAQVGRGAAKADQAGQALRAIRDAVEATVNEVDEIASAAQKMAAASRGVVEAMFGISAVLEENTASTEEMAAQAGQVTAAIQSIASVAGQQSAATDEVSASAQSTAERVAGMGAQTRQLAETADYMRNLVARFTVEESAVPGDGADNVVRLRRAA